MLRKNKQVIIIALFFIVVDIFCWISQSLYFQKRTENILNTWMDMEMTIVKEAGRASQQWLNHKVLTEKEDQKSVEKEIFKYFIKPIKLLKNGDAWIYNRSYIVFDESVDVPEEYQEKSMRDVFEIQKKNGASHYEKVVQGVETGGEGKDWYIWLPEKGREYSAWTSIGIGDETWTIGLSTPEGEILEQSGIYDSQKREIIGFFLITFLSVVVFIMLLISKKNENEKMLLLQESNHNQKELIERNQEKSMEIHQKNIQLSKASKAKDEFLANMSHELRTPLNTIITISEGLHEKSWGLLNQEQNQRVSHIHSSGMHLLSLINDILDLAKIESGKIRLDSTKVSLRSLCDGCMIVIQPLAKQKNISIQLSVDSSLHSCWGDELRLRQILVNLMGNAVKFTPEGKTIGLSIGKDDSLNVVRFEVWDHGIGISPENMRKIFQPFIQLDSRLSRLYGGSGLGLAIAFRMVQLHGGSISLLEESPVGCRFIVRIPDIPLPKEATLLDTLHWKGIVFTENEYFMRTLHQFSSQTESPDLIFLNQLDKMELQKILPQDFTFILLDLPVLRHDTLEIIEFIRKWPGKEDVPLLVSLSLNLPGDQKLIDLFPHTIILTQPVDLPFLVKTIKKVGRA